MAKRANGEGSIYQRPDGRWCGQVSAADGERKTYYGKTQAEVRKKVRDAVAKLDAGMPLGGKAPTLERWLTGWLESLRRGETVRPLTLKSYEGYCRRDIIPALGKLRLDQVTRSRIQGFLDEQAAKGRAAWTITHHRSILRRVLNLAVQDGVIARNPVAGTRIRRTDTTEVKPLTPDQVLTLLDAAQRTMWHAPLTVAVSTGLRPGELLGLTWGDVNLEARTLRVRQAVQRFEGSLHVTGVKTPRSRRTIPLPGLAVVALREQWSGAGRVLPTAYVFPSKSGRPIEPRNLTRAFKRVAARAELPPETRLYDLRHACASLLLAAGEHPRVVADLLGHSTTKLTTDTYSHVLPSLARSAADRLDAILSSGRLQ